MFVQAFPKPLNKTVNRLRNATQRTSVSLSASGKSADQLPLPSRRLEVYTYAPVKG